MYTPNYGRRYPHEQQFIGGELQDLLRAGVVEQCVSEWNSAVLFVPKPGGQWRFCVDYRPLNKVTVTDEYPTPLVDDVLDAFVGSELFSKVDFKSGFWQMQILTFLPNALNN